ncbi:NAD-dependent epimerase/dehydratase family protein [Metabacillus litoralis]|uniref:NAD-dependent epimerase/dehydratase family protein n=1 Tax=Metabacillus litoralis TaxID=152268 RepID=UPI0022B35110|nr:NAD(P)-dependent oxidoreductase [Metabacillus litoralis]
MTGANGYIGLHLKRILERKKYKVVTSTRENNGSMYMDFSKPSEVLSQYISGIDVMIHTVSPNDKLFKTNPYNALSENAMGIHAALDFCVNNNIRNFIYFSSFHVFGTTHGILNETSHVAPQSDYGLAHYVAEQTVQMFDRNKKLNAWIIRPSNLFGIPVLLDKFKRWNLIPFLFCKEAVNYNTITLLTPGNQLRNFVGVTDVCKRVLWILDETPDGRIIHSYGKETISVFQFALLVQKVALETFNLPVRIIRPERKDTIVDFQFTSIYDNQEILPEDELKIFVEEMLRLLLDNK